MIKYPYKQAHPSELDESLRAMIKIIVWIYLIISAVMALLFGTIIVGITISYCLLRVIVCIVGMLLHKHIEFSFLDSFYSLLQQTRQYATSQEV